MGRAEVWICEECGHDFILTEPENTPKICPLCGGRLRFEGYEDAED